MLVGEDWGGVNEAKLMKTEANFHWAPWFPIFLQMTGPRLPSDNSFRGSWIQNFIWYTFSWNFFLCLTYKKLRNTFHLPKITKNSSRLTHHGIQVESIDVWSVHAVPELDTTSCVVYGHLGTNKSCCVIGSSSTGLGVDVSTWKMIRTPFVVQSWMNLLGPIFLVCQKCCWWVILLNKSFFSIILISN